MNACTERSQLAQGNWLLGTWENKTSKRSVYETWIKENDQEFSAMSYGVEGPDTLLFETVRLVEEKDKLFFIPQVNNQNEGQSVRFTLKDMTPTSMVFENPKHDFPQTIAYTLVKPDSLVAIISGDQNGQYAERKFPMKRLE